MNYEQVPSMISGKDLDYLSDLFNWNYGAYKQVMNSKDKVNNQEVATFITKASTVFYDNLTMVLNILKQGGRNE